MTQTAASQCTAEASSAPPENPAVARCLDAWEQVYNDLVAKGKSCPSIDAAKAYCKAMPPLSGYENIRDFIACTAQGILIGAIDATRSSKLLYAAQVALSTARFQPPPRNLGPA